MTITFASACKRMAPRVSLLASLRRAMSPLGSREAATSKRSNACTSNHDSPQQWPHVLLMRGEWRDANQEKLDACRVWTRDGLAGTSVVIVVCWSALYKHGLVLKTCTSAPVSRCVDPALVFSKYL